MQNVQRCWGVTRNLHRCGRCGEWKLFCEDHKRQPLIAASFLLFTVIAGTASIYSAWFSRQAGSVNSKPKLWIRISDTNELKFDVGFFVMPEGKVRGIVSDVQAHVFF